MISRQMISLIRRRKKERLMRRESKLRKRKTRKLSLTKLRGLLVLKRLQDRKPSWIRQLPTLRMTPPPLKDSRKRESQRRRPMTSVPRQSPMVRL